MSESWANRIRHVGMNRYEIDGDGMALILQGEVMEAIAEWWGSWEEDSPIGPCTTEVDGMKPTLVEL